ncbi:MAG: hypothetical protein HN842_09705, partial [Gammaproteobacteria bacterium]|nr:hypothetical protein [Gammaproteobacteria bacterium]
VENLPPWATLNADTGEISGIPENRHVGHYPEILISVSDGIEIVSLPSFTIEVSNANDAPTISGQPAQKVLQGGIYQFLPEIIDVDPSDTLTITVENLPPWAALNAGTGEISGIPENRHVGHYPEILISVNDGVESAQLSPFSIEVISTNDAPIIKGNPGTVAVDGLMYNFTPIGSDSDGDTLSYSATNLPEWLTLDQATGMISGTPAINDIGRTYSDILLTISDGQESVSLSPFAIEVKDASRISSVLNSALSSPSELTVKSGRTYITLSWNDSSPDALGYSIYRLNAAGTEIEEIFYADPGATSITDAGLTPETSYIYYVSVFNQVGGSTPATISGTTTNASSTILQLHGGWNLIHLPQQTSVSEIKQQVPEIESIWGFINCSKGWEYTLYEKDSNQTVVGSEITNLEPGRGYWVSLSGIDKSEWTDVEIEGIALTTPITIDNLTLYSGWNSVGVSIPVIISETELPEQITAIWGWEKYWVSHVDDVPTFLNSLQNLDKNKGYFVYSDAASSGATSCENAH